MNDTPNFSSILDEAPTEIDRPKPLPAGTYICIVGTPEEGVTQRKQTPYVRFPLKPIAALEDVDPTDLEEAGGLANKTLRTDFYVTPDSIFRLDEFHTHCGLDISDAVPRRIRNTEVVNAEVLAVVKHNSNPTDPSRIYAEVARTAPVGE